MIVAILAQDLSMSYSWWSWNKSWWNSSDWTGWQQSQYNNYSNSRWYHNQDQHQARYEPEGKFIGWSKRKNKWNRVDYDAKRSRFTGGCNAEEVVLKAQQLGKEQSDSSDSQPARDQFPQSYSEILEAYDRSHAHSFPRDSCLAALAWAEDFGIEVPPPPNFKLQSHGKRSSQSTLTIEGPPGVVLHQGNSGV